MKKTMLLLATLLASLCLSATMRAASRTAPVLPSPVAPESGQSYYLYNVEEGKFLCESTTNSNHPAIGTYGSLLTLTEEDYGWTIRLRKYSSYYIYAYDTYTEFHSNWSSVYYFTITTSSKGYTIQRAPYNKSYYKADEYLGYDGSSGDRIRPDLLSGSIDWLFMPVEEAKHYFARLRLYTALNTADTYNFSIERFEAVYADASASTDFLNQTADALEDAIAISSSIISPSWSDYKIFFQNPTDNRWSLNNAQTGLMWYTYSSGTITSTLRATVVIDEDATLVYEYSGTDYGNLRVLLDGNIVQEVSRYRDYSSNRYFVELKPGKHDIEWTVVDNYNGSSSYTRNYYLNNIGIEKTPTISVNLLEPGSLGTEILYNVDHVKDVRRLIVKGPMNSDDWEKIMMMTSLFSLDLTDADIETIPDAQFSYSSHRDNVAFLHKVKLPKSLVKIGNNAFYELHIDSIEFPETLSSIGSSAFYGTRIVEANIPENVRSIGASAFSYNYNLKKATWPASVTTIPSNCFSNCKMLTSLTIPEGVTAIGASCFDECYNLNTRLPKTVKTIGDYAFYYTAIDTIVINENVDVGTYAFNKCRKLVYAELPTTYYGMYKKYKNSSSDEDRGEILQDCTSLSDVYFKSPTVITKVVENSQEKVDYFFNGSNPKLTIHVPDYLVNAYKLDPYWYNYAIEGFSTKDVKDWTISLPLTLNARDRFDGEPNLNLQWMGLLKINGEAPQVIDNLHTIWNYRAYFDDGSRTQLLSNCDKVTIKDQFKFTAITDKNQWVFICLPFDTNVDDIESDGQFAIRYYDGGNRAQNGASGSWKNFDAGSVIPAGTGFILQTSIVGKTTFKALNNASKQYALSTLPFTKALQANDSDVPANKGWNLVGNPWQCYYNIHKLNFTAPITVWNGSGYTAYSVIDDDYALQPLQAFFVQCPDEVASIGFPTEGRQLNKTIESQNATRPLHATSATRLLLDIELTSADELTDKTRVVLNEAASTDYETTCDASKFFSMDENVPQLFTIESDGTQYAINERNLGNGIVGLGLYIPTSGTYTLRLTRNDIGMVYLVDNETGDRCDLSLGDYTFVADAGFNQVRFHLEFADNATTGISQTDTKKNETPTTYDMQGRRTSLAQPGVKVLSNGQKVMVK